MIPIPFYDTYIKYKVIAVGDTKTIDYTYLQSEFMLAIMILRICMLVRSLLYYTKYMDPYAKRLCKSYGFDSDAFFTIKSML